MDQHRQRVRDQFGAAAEAYVASRTHAGGDDLARLVAWAEGGPAKRALDVATGGGHTALALAPHYGYIVASDLTPRMLRAADRFFHARGTANIALAGADAEALPFRDGAFDAVSCRIAPHHFASPARFVREAARVLRPAGIFLLEDSVLPDDPDAGAFLNRAEVLRDATHVRSLSLAEWREIATGAGLAVEETHFEAKTHRFDDWLARANTPEPNRAALHQLFRDAAPPVRDALAITIGPDGRVLSYADQKLLLKARKR